LLDLEFITQHAILTSPVHQVHCPGLMPAQYQLFETGIWTADEHQCLSGAFAFLQALQQVKRVADAKIASAAEFSNALRDRLCRAVDADDFDSLSDQLEQTCETVLHLFCKKIGDPATEI